MQEVPSLQETTWASLQLRAGFFHCRCDGCEAVLLGIEQQVLRANQYKENHHRTQQQVEAEVKRKGAFVPLLRVCLELVCSAIVLSLLWCEYNKQPVNALGLVLEYRELAESERA